MSDETAPPPRLWFQDADEARARARPVGAAGALPIHPEALEAATALVSRAASEDAGALFRTIVELRRDRPDDVLHETHLATFLAGFGPEDHEAEEQVRGADRAFAEAFGTRLVLEEHLSGGSGRRCFFLAAELAAIVDGVAASASGPFDEVVLDAVTKTWVAIVAGAVRSGRGHHLALRSEGPGDRALADFSVGLAQADVDVLAIAGFERPALALLRCELHGGPRASAVVADCDVLAADPDGGYDPDECWEAAAEAATDERPLRMRASTRALLPALAGTRNTYVWRVPLEGSLPRDFAAIVGGRIGPVALDASWSLTSLLEASPGLGSAGVRRLLLAAGDPRDARALVAMAEVAATIPGLEAPEDACRFVAASLRPSRTTNDEPGNVPAVPFDERLIACDERRAGAARPRRGALRGVPHPGGRRAKRGQIDLRGRPGARHRAGLRPPGGARRAGRPPGEIVGRHRKIDLKPLASGTRGTPRPPRGRVRFPLRAARDRRSRERQRLPHPVPHQRVAADARRPSRRAPRCHRERRGRLRPGGPEALHDCGAGQRQAVARAGAPRLGERPAERAAGGLAAHRRRRRRLRGGARAMPPARP